MEIINETVTTLTKVEFNGCIYTRYSTSDDDFIKWVVDESKELFVEHCNNQWRERVGCKIRPCTSIPLIETTYQNLLKSSL